jgi:hypothetical protein
VLRFGIEPVAQQMMPSRTYHGYIMAKPHQLTRQIM